MESSPSRHLKSLEFIHTSREQFRRNSLATSVRQTKISEGKSDYNDISIIVDQILSIDSNMRPSFDLDEIRTEMQLRKLRLNDIEKEFEELEYEVFMENKEEGEQEQEEWRKAPLDTVPTLTSPRPEEEPEEVEGLGCLAQLCKKYCAVI